MVVVDRGRVGDRVHPGRERVADLTVTVRVTLAPAAKLPMVHVTTPLAKVPPPEALTKVVLAGIVSVAVTPVAPWLPTLLIVSV